MFEQEYLEIGLIAAQVLGVVVLATTLGFVLARWMYQTESASHNAILKKEIMRLRRKLSESEGAQMAIGRSHQRLRRKVKSEEL
jgi:hypothetical protein